MLATAHRAFFQPLQLGPLSLKNRLVMAPMSRYFCPDEVPGEASAAYYARRAGAGLIISEATYIPHPSAHSYRNVPRFYDADALAGWAKVIKAVHAEGGIMFPQLWHTGNFRELGMHPDPAIPGFDASENLNTVQNTTHPAKPMTEADIAAIIEAYADAAASAQALGFDGIEIHGAHGYLIDTFFWRKTNRRTDRWGGDLHERARFGTEIVRAIRARTGPDFPISFRWSQFKQQDYEARLAETPEELEILLGALADAGVDIFHTSTRRIWDPAFPELSPLTLAGWTKKLTGHPVIAVGSVGVAEPHDGINKARALLEEGEADLIAVGRSILADPDWPLKLREDRLIERHAFEPAHLKALE